MSRGQITRFRDGAGSTFDPLEVERLAVGRRRRGQTISRHASPAGTPLMILDTDIALIEDGRLYLRGQDIAGLVDRRYEDVAGWLWGSDEPGTALFEPDPRAVAAARSVVASMPSGTGMIDLIMVATRALAVADPLRQDLSPGRVIRAAGSLLGGLIASLPDHSDGGEGEPIGPTRRLAGPRRPVADRLWPKLTAAKPTRARVGALNAALVLLVDHDLAASTLAARTAASARADPYGVVSAGLATLDSALHGTASVDAYRLLSAVWSGTPTDRALAETLRGRTGVPGFGHLLYAGPDPRATVLLGRLADLPGTKRILDRAGTLAAEVTSRTGQHPNIDFALAALALALGMEAEAGEVIFACSRIGGWIAHALDEYTRPPLRLRPTGRYVGP
ncbi:citrate/2-methylcitrate synthase [Microlunatus speluncae]|uniref:citrate/2-methylcitrate synthase n=1 Tax=Microlunatus speluncae TaxID=2594267 RepID=UPI001C2D660C|nr:citrate/2-methylcitrate synthase [Microlunatus speluncae]